MPVVARHDRLHPLVTAAFDNPGPALKDAGEEINERLLSLLQNERVMETRRIEHSRHAHRVFRKLQNVVNERLF